MSFVRDACGLLHYRHKRLGHITQAIEMAQKDRPDDGAAWFWFNGTPAPMLPCDGTKCLYDRWLAWREAYQSGNPSDLLRMLESMPVEAEKS